MLSKLFFLQAFRRSLTRLLARRQSQSNQGLLGDRELYEIFGGLYISKIFAFEVIAFVRFIERESISVNVSHDEINGSRSNKILYSASFVTSQEYFHRNFCKLTNARAGAGYLM